MRLKYYPVQKLKKEILEILEKHLDVSKYRVFFFGSRVGGIGSERSDIDVGIEGPEPIPSKIKFEIEDEIENLLTLYKIEIVDFRRVPSKFREVALQKIELIK